MMPDYIQRDIRKLQARRMMCGVAGSVAIGLAGCMVAAIAYAFAYLTVSNLIGVGLCAIMLLACCAIALNTLGAVEDLAWRINNRETNWGKGW